ncbi:MAG: SDR family oxidoreductase [Pyrinomonadaceae bacterium]|nr:SDR family oxidoreductase [Phycisphaerales bacterium]
MSTNRIALITGANKGIGLETARQLGKQNITVLIGARDQAKGSAAADLLKKEKIDARFVQIEVTDAASISRAAADIDRDFGRLDILINNAGVMKHGAEGPGSSISQETLRTTFDTNFFGLIAVTQAMLPLIRKSPAGRIVNLTSILGSIAEHADPNSGIYNAKMLAYDASKSALNMFTNHLAHELKSTPIKVNAAHPGWVKTDMGGSDAPMDLVDGAKTSVWLATLPSDGPTGGYYHMMTHLRW